MSSGFYKKNPERECEEGCPSQKLIRGKSVEKIFLSVQRLNAIIRSQVYFKKSSLIEIDSEHKYA